MCFGVSSNLTCLPPWTMYYNNVFYNVVCISVISSLWKHPFLILQLLCRNLVVGWNWSCSPGPNAGWTHGLDDHNYFSSWNHNWFRAGHMSQAWLIALPWESCYFLFLCQFQNYISPLSSWYQKTKQDRKKEWASNFPTTYRGTSSWLGMKTTWRKQWLVMERERERTIIWANGHRSSKLAL